MKKINVILGVLLVVFMSSCLTAGLEDLPVYTDAEITNFKFEYRWAEKEGLSDVLRVKPLNLNLNINKETQEVICNITVPAADAQFTAAVREKVTLNNIVGFGSISTAATIRPLGNSPVLGKPGDFGQSDMKYEVIAADKKTKKTWTIIINSFEK